MRLGILGGGQLGKMTAIAAAQFGIEPVIWSPHPKSPAAMVSCLEIHGDLQEPTVLDRISEQVDCITLENEFIDADILEALRDRKTPVFPLPRTVAIIQDKWRQKSFLREAGLPVPRTEAVPSCAELHRIARQTGFPLILKTRRLGYDGHGTTRVDRAEEIDRAWALLGGDRNSDSLMVEEYIPFEKELAVMVVRDRRGQAVSYPVVETRQPRHICESVFAPASVPPGAAAEARRIAIEAIRRLEGVGAFGVELFWTGAKTLLINEIAPRPHNSGHYTIEACVASQFENHVRAVVGFSLGNVDMVAPRAVMLNLLGTRTELMGPEVLTQASAIPGAHLHWYGKSEVRPGRKMGHVTALGRSLDEAHALAAQAAARIDI